MKVENVAIWVKSTNQTATAKWHLEGIGLSDSWVAVIDEISELKPFPMFSKVSVTFKDRVREAEFYCGNGTLIQKDSSKLDFWLGKENKESEEKSMLHNVTVKIEENKVLEAYWTIRGGIKGNSLLRPYHELDHEPTPEEIAQFIHSNKVDYAFIEENYRFENELPFC